MKYQFCIRFENIDTNSAASKAVLDCNKIFSRRGYVDHTFTVGDNKKKVSYYFSLLKELIVFFASIKNNSLIGIQYPLLSINDVFKYFVKLARIKKAKVFCIVHDLESLRKGGSDTELVKKEVDNLNAYDEIIVHNPRMRVWLEQRGVTCKMTVLELFDYLSDDFNITAPIQQEKIIVYAGNLGKSTFIYQLGEIKKNFNVYGPNLRSDACPGNVTWQGEFSPDDVQRHLAGSFGLIWDGTEIDTCDELLGNYLRYNNPHKASLYIAAGLPIIAPSSSAIGEFILKTGTGVVVDSLEELNKLNISEFDYIAMQKNVLVIRQQVLKGAYFERMLTEIEELS